MTHNYHYYYHSIISINYILIMIILTDMCVSTEVMSEMPASSHENILLIYMNTNSSNKLAAECTYISARTPISRAMKT